MNLSTSKRALVEKLSQRDESKEKRKKWQNEQRDEDGNLIEVDPNSTDFKAVIGKKLNKYVDPAQITIFNDSQAKYLYDVVSKEKEKAAQ